MQNEKIIDAFIKDEETAKADATLQAQLTYFKTNKQFDSLHKYPYYVGKIEVLKSNTELGITAAENFLLELEAKTRNKATLSKAYTNISLLYDELGKNQKSYDISLKAVNALKNYNAATPDELGKVIYNLGLSAQTLGRNDEAKQFFNETLSLYEAYPKTSKVYLSKAYNATAVMFYLSSKLDSAEVYFIKAANAIENAKGDRYENLLDTTVISSNVMLVQYTQSNTTAALKTLEQVVKNYNVVLKNTNDESTRAKVVRFNSNALSNLAVIYNKWVT